MLLFVMMVRRLLQLWANVFVTEKYYACDVIVYIVSCTVRHCTCFCCDRVASSTAPTRFNLYTSFLFIIFIFCNIAGVLWMSYMKLCQKLSWLHELTRNIVLKCGFYIILRLVRAVFICLERFSFRVSTFTSRSSNSGFWCNFLYLCKA